MCRPYSTEKFRRKVELIKARLDRPAITTDIIVGFPSETDEDFEQTLGLAREVGFSRIHVFSFSPRQGTAAAKMKPKIKSEVVKHRAAELQKLADELAYQYRQQFLDQTAEALIENIDENGTAFGRAERYFEVRIPDAPYEIRRNDIIKVALTANSSNGMTSCLSSA
jgi:threonylcarbamoyladenosine tRNA methylthiotransferase MtaB